MLHFMRKKKQVWGPSIKVSWKILKQIPPIQSHKLLCSWMFLIFHVLTHYTLIEVHSSRINSKASSAACQHWKLNWLSSETLDDSPQGADLLLVEMWSISLNSVGSKCWKISQLARKAEEKQKLIFLNILYFSDPEIF